MNPWASANTPSRPPSAGLPSAHAAPARDREEGARPARERPVRAEQGAEVRPQPARKPARPKHEQRLDEQPPVDRPHQQNTTKATVNAPYASGASHRASSTFSTKLPPANSAWSSTDHTPSGPTRRGGPCRERGAGRASGGSAGP